MRIQNTFKICKFSINCQLTCVHNFAIIIKHLCIHSVFTVFWYIMREIRTINKFIKSNKFSTVLNYKLQSNVKVCDIKTSKNLLE